ncbi:hypothetical protein D3C72_1234360 [compost metagenome]
MAPLQQPQGGEQQEVERQQQQGAAGAGPAPLEVRVLIPEPEPHRQGGRGIWPQQQGEIHHSQAIGRHRIEGQAQGGPEGGQQQAPPDLRPAEAHGLPKPLLAADSGGVEGRERHQQQKGGLFQDERQNEAEPPGISQGLPVGRQVKAGEGGGDQAQQPAGGGEQEGHADGEGDVGQGQQGGEQAAQPAHPGSPLPPGEQQGGEEQGPQGGGPRHPEAQAHRVPEPGLGEQQADMAPGQALEQQEQQAAGDRGGQRQGTQQEKEEAPGPDAHGLVAVAFGPGRFQPGLPAGMGFGHRLEAQGRLTVPRQGILAQHAGVAPERGIRLAGLGGRA